MVLFCMVLILAFNQCSKDTIIDSQPEIVKTSPPDIDRLRAIYNDTNSVEVSWGVNTDTSKFYLITEYEIIYARDSQSVAEWDTLNTESIKYTPLQLRNYEKVVIENISKDSIYYFALKFHDISGTVSQISNIVNPVYEALPEIEYGTPAEVENFRVRRVGEDYVDLIWELPDNIPIENTIFEYMIRYAEYDGNYGDWFGWFRLVKDTAFKCKASEGERDSIRIDNLDSGRKYYFKMFTQKPRSYIWPIDLITATTTSQNSYTWHWQFDQYGYNEIAGFQDSKYDIVFYGAQGRNAYIGKFDPDANLQWFNRYTELTIHKVAEIENQNYILAGESGYRNLIMQQMDSDGRLTWRRIYPYPEIQTVREFARTLDKGFIVISSTGQYAWENTLIHRINSENTMIWTKTYSNGPFNIVLPPEELENGHFLLMGLDKTDSPAGYNRLVKLELDRDGNEIGIERNDLQGSFDGISNVKRTGFNEITTLGNKVDLSTGLSVLKLCRYDLNGNLYDAFTIDRSNYLRSSDFLLTADGGHLIAGMSNAINQESMYNGTGILIKLGSAGNILWEKEYAFASQTRITGLFQQPDRGYIVTANLKLGLPYSNATVFRIDENGEF